MSALALPAMPAQEATVDARQLHESLGVGRDFATWIKDQIERFNLVEHEHFEVFPGNGENPQGGRPTTEYALSLAAAEMIAISMRTPEAQRARAALLDLKRQWNNPAAVMARALQMAAAESDRLRAEAETALARVAELEPKAETFDRLMGVDDVLPMVQAANVLAHSCGRKLGRNRLFRILRNMRILKSDNTPYQEHIEASRFKVIERLWQDPHGKDHVKPQTYVTQRGMAYLQRLLSGEPGPVVVN